MDIKDLTAFCQALVVGLSRHYDNGTQLPYLDSGYFTKINGEQLDMVLMLI